MYPLDRNPLLQMPDPVSMEWVKTEPDTDGGKILYTCWARCAACQKEARGWVNLGFPGDFCEDEYCALNELEALGCSHCEPARIAIDLLDLENPIR